MAATFMLPLRPTVKLSTRTRIAPHVEGAWTLHDSVACWPATIPAVARRLPCASARQSSPGGSASSSSSAGADAGCGRASAPIEVRAATRAAASARDPFPRRPQRRDATVAAYGSSTASLFSRAARWISWVRGAGSFMACNQINAGRLSGEPARSARRSLDQDQRQDPTGFRWRPPRPLPSNHFRLESPITDSARALSKASPWLPTCVALLTQADDLVLQLLEHRAKIGGRLGVVVLPFQLARVVVGRALVVGDAHQHALLRLGDGAQVQLDQLPHADR